MVKEQIPPVSVVIPLFNDRKRIGEAIESILVQTYPKNKLEVIVVNNGSTDSSEEIVALYPVKLLHRCDVMGPGAARNRGIEASTGEVLAFMDSDCIAEPNWVEEGVSAMLSREADLVAGDIRFELSDKPSSAEYYHAISSGNNWLTVPTRNIAKTGNLFVKRIVFNDIGLFREDLFSGQDVYFTGLATFSGYRLIYCCNSAVHHPAKKLIPLLKSCIRVARGKKRIARISQGQEHHERVTSRQGGIRFHLNPFSLKLRLIQRGYKTGPFMLLRIVLVSYCALAASCLGHLMGKLIRVRER